MKVLSRFAAALFGAAFLIAAFAGPASATTFCVPGFFAECPDNGSNIGAPDFGIAATSNASDGQADTVMLDAVDFVSTLPIAITGSDDLTVIGRGRDKSSISTSASTNSYVLTTNGRTGLVTMKDLAIIAPASFPDSGGYGAVLQSQKDDFENVDLISENPGSSGASSTIGGGTFTNVRVFGRNGGTIDRAFETGCSDSGPLVIDGAELSTAGSAVTASCPAVPVTVSRALIHGDGTLISASNGAALTVTNSVLESGDYSPVSVYNAKGAPTNVALDQVTLVAVGDNTKPAILAQMANVVAATGNIGISVRNSIIAGFQNTWNLAAPAAADRGDVGLTLQYSDFGPTGEATGDSTVDSSIGNIDDTPGFAGVNDYHLTPSSPAVDAGDPGQVDPIFDFEGNGRPIDGNFDGNPVRDMGAYELNPPPPNCPINPDACIPKISKVKFRYRFGKGGALRLNLSNKSKVVAVFTPVPKKAKPKRKTIRILKQGKAGVNVIKLGKRVLKPGRYRLAIRARNVSGDPSKIVIRKIRIKAPK